MANGILQALKNFTWKRWLVLVLFFAVLSFTGFYAYRTAERAAYWRGHHDQPLANWMSINYIAHSYRVPLPVLYEAINLQPEPRDRRPLTQIAKMQNVTVEEIKTKLETAIADFRAANPPPPELGGNR